MNSSLDWIDINIYNEKFKLYATDMVLCLLNGGISADPICSPAFVFSLLQQPISSHSTTLLVPLDHICHNNNLNPIPTCVTYNILSTITINLILFPLALYNLY